MMNQPTFLAALAFALTSLPALAQQTLAPPPTPVARQDKTQPTPRLNPLAARAARLSDRMVHDLHLNGYQASRLRAINEEKVAKIAAIERKNAGNNQRIDEECQGVCQERDKELQTVLSTDQYSTYYGARSTYYKYDRDYAAQSASILLTDAVQNPAPSRANNATISTPTTGGKGRTAQ